MSLKRIKSQRNFGRVTFGGVSYTRLFSCGTGVIFNLELYLKENFLLEDLLKFEELYEIQFKLVF